MDLERVTAISLHVNGRPIAMEAEPRQHLADFIREELLLTGTHLGCEHGVCGACTVLIDGVPARSCIAFPAALQESEITTIEGLVDDPIIERLRDAFAAEHGLQCGFCTPGMLIMARDIVLRCPGADENAIRHELAGNLCRCTGYVGIVRAIKRVVDDHLTSPIVLKAEAPEAFASPLRLPVVPRRSVLIPVTATPAKETPNADGASSPQDDGAFATPKAEPLRNPVTFAQSFRVNAPRETVWLFFQQPANVLACLPGARLSAPSDGRTLAAELIVKLGPIQAVFAGTGVIEADRETWTGIIEGGGIDQRSASRVQSRLVYRLSAEQDETVVHIDIAYALQGPLAQMSRSALARDIAGRMTQSFANRLSSALSCPAQPETNPPIQAGGMLRMILVAWIDRLFRR